MAVNLSSEPRRTGCRSVRGTLDPGHQIQHQTPTSRLDQRETLLEVDRFAVVGVRHVHRTPGAPIVGAEQYRAVVHGPPGGQAAEGLLVPPGQTDDEILVVEPGDGELS